ncbi:tyrosine 2,3-aminomutase [Streptomyces cahuitamycinicus]|uniref:Tyrosine 2,3-aminomutase n=2 Tax=Streptomyces cahuitamycinicus TaxID=2070367 RepID=A0A2N8TXY9_9ACTN|nr:tyrosine 2,3-aminomutase [Streptomyces cahuitamycinicus]
MDGTTLTIDALLRIAEDGAQVRLAGSALARVHRNRGVLEELVRRGVPVDGVTVAGHGTRRAGIEPGGQSELQANLIRSQCTGVGRVFAQDEARAMVATLLNGLAKGHSGVRPEVLEHLVRQLNAGVTPAIPEIGSLGPEGDRTPLAHVASTLLGEGEVLWEGRRTATAGILAGLGISPLPLSYREGHALTSGAAGMTGLGCLVVRRALDQVRQAEIATALLAGALDAPTAVLLTTGPERASTHRGTADTVTALRELLRGEFVPSARKAARPVPGHILAEVPQVLGAARQALYDAVRTLEAELNSAGSGPLFVEGTEVFHTAACPGRPVAAAMERVKLSLAQLGPLVEQQFQDLLSGGPDGSLPENLVVADPVSHHGFSGVRRTVAALVAENRSCSPVGARDMPTGGCHDLGVPGMVAARGARRIMRNNYRVLAAQFLATAQAVDVARRFGRLAPAAQAAYDAVRSLVPLVGVDRALAGDIELISTALQRGEILADVGRYTGIAPR